METKKIRKGMKVLFRDSIKPEIVEVVEVREKMVDFKDNRGTIGCAVFELIEVIN